MPPVFSIEKIIDIATAAGDIIMKFYQSDVGIEIKKDNSPVTEADIAANDYITAQLTEHTPDIALVSEESKKSDNISASHKNTFWIIDPLDGTKSFIKGTGEFTVNIALIDNHTPIAGVVYVPAQEIIYYTDGNKAYRQKRGEAAEEIQARTIPEEGAVVVASLSHRTPETDEYINSIKVKEIVSASSSVKLCKVAEGSADVYPRFGATMEWDIAAGHAVLNAAGGSIKTVEGEPFIYGKEDTLLNPYFIAEGKR